MKNLTNLCVATLLMLLASSCSDKVVDSYVVNEPVYMTYNDLRSSFEVTDEVPVQQPGKLYFKDNLIFINEYQKGVHVVDNHDPEYPQFLKFIEIPGNVDIAIKNNILYADSYVDLLAIDISNLNDIKMVNRLENVFPYVLPEHTEGMLGQVDQEKGVVTQWKQEKVDHEIEPNSYDYKILPYYRGEFLYTMDMAASPASNGGESFGVGGSMARFTIYSSYLYAIDNSSLHIFDISTPESPLTVAQQSVGWQIETLFPYQDKLFIGSTTGMFIYDLSADPTQPSLIGQFRHASSCDPVVVENKYAYITLRAGNLCGQTESQLDVVDITDPGYPVFVKAYPMDEPYGLGIDNSVLFVCDGNSGLKIYNATDPLKIADNKLAEYPDINSYDVIPLGNVLLLIGQEGLYQYDYSRLDSIHLLSYLPLNGRIIK